MYCIQVSKVLEDSEISYLEEDVLGGDVHSGLGPSGLPEIPETGLVGLEAGDIGLNRKHKEGRKGRWTYVELVDEAGGGGHDEHESAEDSLPHIGSLLLFGNGLHEGASVKGFLNDRVRNLTSNNGCFISFSFIFLPSQQRRDPSSRRIPWLGRRRARSRVDQSGMVEWGRERGGFRRSEG